jgi:hypothetical protein
VIGWHIANAPVYPVDPVASTHGAGVEHETAVPKEAYAPFSEDTPVPFREPLPRPQFTFRKCGYEKGSPI